MRPSSASKLRRCWATTVWIRVAEAGSSRADCPLSNRFLSAALQSCDVGVDNLFSADGHFPTSRPQSSPDKDPTRGAERRRRLASLRLIVPNFGTAVTHGPGRARRRRQPAPSPRGRLKTESVRCVGLRRARRGDLVGFAARPIGTCSPRTRPRRQYQRCPDGPGCNLPSPRSICRARSSETRARRIRRS